MFSIDYTFSNQMKGKKSFDQSLHFLSEDGNQFNRFTLMKLLTEEKPSKTHGKKMLVLKLRNMISRMKKTLKNLTN
jgi:hypothetical protein